MNILILIFGLCVTIDTEETSVNGSNGSQMVHQDEIRNLNDINEPSVNDLNLVDGVCVIHLSLAERNIVFRIASTMLQLL